jgi:hypothetical protein
MDTVEDWAVLTTAFAAEWLDLEGFMDVNDEPLVGRDQEGKTEL